MGAFDYNSIKAIAKQTGCVIADLLALASNNDPFYVGRPSTVEAAEWFARLWRQFGYGRGVHLRRIHYQIVSQDPPVKRPDGRVYENTEQCWDFLNNASKWARYLGLVSPDAFVDRRNPDAIVNAAWNSVEPEPVVDLLDYWEAYDYELPNLPTLRPLPDRLPSLPRMEAGGGFDYIQQPYLIEVWAEKTTMNDVLEPVCRRYRANLVTGAGELSITAVRSFLKRVEEAGRPARILYISDFDPAGLGMPISVARKIEFYQRTDGYDQFDIALQPVVLTADQVGEFQLPRVPVKDSDLRKEHFEEAYGQGQVELDALEALYPGELARIVVQEILRYYDTDLFDRAEEAKQALQNELDRIRGEIISEHEDELIEVRTEYQEVVEAFEQTRQEFDRLVEQFVPQIESHRERLERLTERAKGVNEKIYDELNNAYVDLAEYPVPDAEVEGDPYGLLYDSSRDYLDQLEAYKARRNGEVL